MRPSTDCNGSHIPFLEPPHSHDPTSVSIIAALPPNVMQQLPSSVQSSLWELQQSASVAYASYCRLQDLLDERFDRLTPLGEPNGQEFSESAFFNYENHVRAEKDYLISDAYPDWRHKASIATSALRPYNDYTIGPSRLSRSQTIAQWQTSLQSTVSSWLDEAKKVTIPSFEDTVQEFLNYRKQAVSLDSEESTPSETPIHEDEPQFTIRCPSHFDVVTNSSKVATLNCYPSKRVEIRKDSGIEMDC